MVAACLLHRGGLVCLANLGGSCLHSGGSVSLENPGGSCLHSGGSWGPGVPSLDAQV